MRDIFGDFSKILKNGDSPLQIEKDTPLSRKTTFKIGGTADLGVYPKNEQELIYALLLCRDLCIPRYVMGRGSNLLVSDEGFRGAVIFTEKMQSFRVRGDTVTVDAGMGLTSLSRKAGEKGLSGLEFACGIPGSVGGAVVMNAGAYGGEMKDVVKRCRVFYPQSVTVDEVDNSSCGFSYRHSVFMENGGIVISAVLELSEDDPSKIKKREDELLSRRREKQPLEYASAGSAFKRPEGYFAAKLIDDAGLRALTVGGAQVSEKHAGFVINRGSATSADVIELMRIVRERVFEKFKVELAPEIRYLSPEGEEKI